MQIINYKALLEKHKPDGYISDTANKIANQLICDMRIQAGTGVACFLEVDVCLDNHRAVRIWVQRQLEADRNCNSRIHGINDPNANNFDSYSSIDNDELCRQLQSKLYKLFPDLGVEY